MFLQPCTESLQPMVACVCVCVCACASLTEVVGQLSAADRLGFLAELQGMLGNLVTGDVGRHDEHGVFAFDGLPLAVCEAALREGEAAERTDQSFACHICECVLTQRRRTDRRCAHLIKELQHDGENVRVGLVHFVKQDHSVGTRPQQLGQLTPLLMSYVSRRGADELCHLSDAGEAEV